MNNLHKAYHNENDNTIKSIKYFKSPMNYLGNKYKLLPQIIPLLPDNIDTFYDVFCGGLDISLNVQANKVVANDKQEDLIWLYHEILSYDGENLGDELYKMDLTYFPMNFHDGKALRTYWSTDKPKWDELMADKRINYYLLRDKFNNGDTDFKVAMLLMLNNVGTVEFRIVNKKITFACGKNRISEKLSKAINQLQLNIRNIKFINEDFRFLYNSNLNPNDFVYLDPPYIGTTQYKTRWYQKDEQDMYNLLDYLDKNKIKFALSNFADGEHHTNQYLAKWCGEYNIHNISDSHSNLTGIRKNNQLKRQEILVTNY